jgi:hypothetical protein
MVKNHDSLFFSICPTCMNLASFMSRSALVLLAAAAAGRSCANAFVTWPHTRIAQEQSALHFGIPSFGAKDDKEPKEDEETKIGLSGLVQLITAGMGSPFLGDFEGVDEETGTLKFSLEANNLVDEVRRRLLLFHSVVDH